MDDCIAAIEARNPSINAFTYTAFDEARAKAIEAEKVLMRGDADGAFFGIPTAAKDFLPGVPGWPGTTGGVKAPRHQKDPGYGCFTKAMVDEGAILVGKTNAPSFAFRGTCDNKMFGGPEHPVQGGLQLGRLLGRFRSRGGRWHPACGGRHRLGRRLDPYSRRMVRLLWLQGISWNHPRNREANAFGHR